MSLWKFGNFEAEVDFTDADFLDVLEEAKAEMFEAGKKVPITGGRVISSARSARVFMCFSIPCLAREQGSGSFAERTASSCVLKRQNHC